MASKGRKAPPEPAPSSIAEKAPGRGAHALGLLALALIVALGSFVRIRAALDDPNFDSRSAKPLLRTDPGLLYYFTERIVEAHGRPPADLRADPNIEYPETSDWPAMETVGQEFLVAWCQLLFGGKTPLHVTSVWVMGVFASLAAIGVYGLAYELTRKIHWAVLAALAFSVMSANYRTVGFILIREDVSLPLFALHLYLLARAARVRTSASFVWAGVSLVLAVSTWHAMGFVVSLLAACVFAWFVRTGENPFRTPRAWLVPAVTAVGSCVVPVLWSKLFILSLPMLIMLALCVAAWWNRKGAHGHLACVGVAMGACVGLALASKGVSAVIGGGQEDYAHVFDLLKSKLLYLGVRPADPSKLSFDARLLWQGPFATGTIEDFTMGYPLGALMLVAGAVVYATSWIRGRGDATEATLVAFAVVSAVMGYLIQRLFILPGLVAPVVGVLVLDRLRPAGLALVLMIGGTLVQATQFYGLAHKYVNAWYYPPQRNAELARVVDWVGANVPAGEPIAADFVNSTAILAHTRHPVILQPKYETKRSRERAREFHTAFCSGTLADFRAVLAKYRCRYVLIDLYWMWGSMRYVVGIPEAQLYPSPGTAAAAFANPDPRALQAIPGFRLLYKSNPKSGWDSYRVFAVE